MSRKSVPNGSRSQRAGWSGGSSAREGPLHRWQNAGAATDRGRTASRHLRRRWIVVSGLAAALLAYFVYLLLYQPKLTPLFVFTATKYEPPFPLNPWALEDEKALLTLNGENLELEETTSPSDWDPRIGASQFIPDSFKLSRSRDSEPLIFVISMHGVVNDAGKPCLLQDDANLNSPSDWILVSDVLDEIQKVVTPDRKALLVLDCNRIRANWNLGILYNTFTERLQELVAAERDKWTNVAILTSAGAGQESWASAELKGSVFRHYLLLGIAGAADEGENGNDDEEVSLSELTAYLQREVDAWSQFNRGESQQPVLMPAKADDFRVVRVAPHGTLSQHVESLRTPTTNEPDDTGEDGTAPSVSPESIGELWSQFEELRKLHDLVRFDPGGCRRVEHELLRLEELSYGGAAYKEGADGAEARYSHLKEVLSQALVRAKSAGASRALADSLEIVSADGAEWAGIPTAAHTLPTAEYFGACDVKESKRIEEFCTELILSADAKETQALVETVGDDAIARGLAETQLLVSSVQQQVATLWTQKTILENVLKRRRAVEWLAVPRGSGGSIGDERAHYYTRSIVNIADAQRRLAEDIVFVGELNAPKNYDEWADKTDELCNTARQVMDESSKAYQTGDNVYARLPYLAAWLCSPLAAQYPDRNDLVQKKLIPLIQGAHQLGDEISRIERLRQPKFISVDGGLPFSALASQVDDDFEEFNTQFQAEFTRLNQGAAQGARGWRSIQAVLMCPQIPGDVRKTLLKNRAKISTTLHGQFLTNETSDTENVQSPETSYLSEISSWSTHPLLELLQVQSSDKPVATTDEGDEGQLARCESSGTEARHRLTEPSHGEAVERETAEPAMDEEVFRERRQLSRAARKFRAAAAFDFTPVEPMTGPIYELRKFDIQQLLLWHAQRTLDDFWGDFSAPTGEQPFFARAAQDYLNAAMNLGEQEGEEKDVSFATAKAIDRLQRLLTERLQAKNDKFEITPTASLLVDPADAVTISLEVKANDEAEYYPNGIGALSVRGQALRLKEVKLIPDSNDGKAFVKLPPEPNAPQGFRTVVTDTAGAGSKLTAVEFFRGRENASPEFPLPTRQGVVIDYEPNRYDGQSISLRGLKQQVSSVVLILDCSWSMEDPPKSAAGKKEVASKMRIASDHLNTMLRELAARNRQGEDTRVGVWFYGHRVVWTKDTRRKIEQEKLKARIKSGLLPSEDVERIYPLGRFDYTAADQVGRVLQNVEAWGQTPLYLSLKKALDEFDKDGLQTRKCIIAITDGEDYQWEPDSRSGRAPVKTNITSLLDAWRKKKEEKHEIPIHLLSFDMPQNENERARPEFEKIKHDTGGSYAEVTTSIELLNALRERLDLDGYIVSDRDNQPVNRVEDGRVIPIRLNESVEITKSVPPKQQFTVEFRSDRKTVELEGGEAIRLLATTTGAAPEIVAIPYDPPRAEDSDSLVANANGQPTSYFLRAHRPRRISGGVRFPISLQLDPKVNHFTARPAETWVEITPVAGSIPAGQPYVFYDRNYEPDTPVPVLDWTAANWPQDANKARIRFWCKGISTDPLQKIALNAVENAPNQFRQPQPVRGVPGVEVSIDQTTGADSNYEINVVEHHDSRSPGIDAIRVHFESDASIKPTRIVHQFDAPNRIVRHTFYFSPEMRGRIAAVETSCISISKATDVKDGALQLRAGSELEVSIDAPGDFFAPDATASGQ